MADIKGFDWDGFKILFPDFKPEMWSVVFACITYGGVTFAGYGAFLGVWSYFEMIVEVLIKKELDLDNQEASIICGGLSFGSKINILYSLLSRDERNNDGLILLREAASTAERNSFAHGFLSGDIKNASLITREVKYEYRVKSKDLNITSLLKHIVQFMEQVNKIICHFRVCPETSRGITKFSEHEAD